MKQQLTRNRIYGIIVGLAAISASAATAEAQETQRQSEQDSTKWGYPTDSNPDVQNPPGYRGMERPASLPDSAEQDSTRRDSAGAVEDRVTGTYDDSTWQDTSAARQNPAGYRGMERPAGDDTSKAGKAGDRKQKAKSKRPKPAAGDTSTMRMSDTTAMQQNTDSGVTGDSSMVTDSSAADSVAADSVAPTSR